MWSTAEWYLGQGIIFCSPLVAMSSGTKRATLVKNSTSSRGGGRVPLHHGAGGGRVKSQQQIVRLQAWERTCALHSSILCHLTKQACGSCGTETLLVSLLQRGGLSTRQHMWGSVGLKAGSLLQTTRPPRRNARQLIIEGF